MEDDSFTRQLIVNALSQQKFQVSSCDNAATAIDLVRSIEPHVLISDLDLGKGATGLDLLRLVNREFPWVGLVVISAHSTPVLVGDGALPEGTPYLVKSEIRDLGEIGTAIHTTLSRGESNARNRQEGEWGSNGLFVTPAQAETLRLLAQGLSNQSISEARGTTLRAAETIIRRTYLALGLSRESMRNNRVEAVSLWGQGKVRVR